MISPSTNEGERAALTWTDYICFSSWGVDGQPCQPVAAEEIAAVCPSHAASPCSAPRASLPVLLERSSPLDTAVWLAPCSALPLSTTRSTRPAGIHPPLNGSGLDLAGKSWGELRLPR